ncbi:MAG: DUF4372 domain-containing protein [Muribaculaceae bacterium]|nr:DUF4372 domain-containing protein [Bacteroides sp.]MDE6843689.1 DUF4372 domain-containing protein [Muribaculaceae bacterium]
MDKDKYVFALSVRFLDRNHFNYPVRKCEGDKYIKSALLSTKNGQ